MDKQQREVWILTFFVFVVIMIVAAILASVELYFGIILTEHLKEVFSIVAIISILIAILTLKYMYNRGLLHPKYVEKYRFLFEWKRK